MTHKLPREDGTLTRIEAFLHGHFRAVKKIRNEQSSVPHCSGSPRHFFFVFCFVSVLIYRKPDSPIFVMHVSEREHPTCDASHIASLGTFEPKILHNNAKT